MDSLDLLDVVVLLTDIPDAKTRKGSLGTVVETFTDDMYLIEFADSNGITYAMPVIPVSQLMKVHQEPVEI